MDVFGTGFALSPEEVLKARLEQARAALYNRGNNVVKKAEKNRFPSTVAPGPMPETPATAFSGFPDAELPMAPGMGPADAYLPNPNLSMSAFNQEPQPEPLRLGEPQPETGAPPVRKVQTEKIPAPGAFDQGVAGGGVIGEEYDPWGNPTGGSIADWNKLTPAEKVEQQDTADAIGYDPQPFDASPLIDLYKERLSALSDEPKESGRDRLARMLINFGAGSYSAASNIKGRTRGPGFAESFGGGATNMGLGELEEKTNKEARAEKRGEKSFSALSDLMKLHLDLQKARYDQRHKAAELEQRGQYYKLLSGKNDDGLAKSVLTALGQGADPSEIIKFLTAIGGADPAMLERLKELSAGQ